MCWPMNPNKRRVWPQLGLALVLFCFLPCTVGEAQPKLPRLLILNEVGTTYPGINLIDQGIRDVLDTSPDKLETYREYMDTILFPDPADQQRFRNFYIRKYQNRKPDVIITVGPSPLKFMLQAHMTDFPGVPIVYGYPNWTPGSPVLGSDLTGIMNDVAASGTIEVALRLQPDTRNIVVVGGTSYMDTTFEAAVKEQLRPYERDYQFSYLTNLAMPDLVERLKHLPNRTFVLLIGFSQDAAGTHFTEPEAGAILAGAATVPVFSLIDSDLGHGEVGGKLSSPRETGRTLGRIALRMFKGEKPQDVPVVKSPTVYMFDWRALKRWGFKERDLPAGSIVVNRQLSVWESYKWYIVGVISLILLEALLISGLLWQRARRRQTTRALEKRTTELQAREELLKIFVKNVPVGVAMLDREMRYLQVSDRWSADYGVDASQILGRSHYETLADMPDRWKEIHRRALDGETLRADEDRWDRKSGTTWVRWEVRPWLNLYGKPGGILIFAEEITRRKQAEEALASVSHKLIEAQEKERTRIARELHDDINQRLALLAVELQQLQQSNPGLDGGVRRRMIDLARHITEIGMEVQAISHRLHSSKLEILGLVSACRGFCSEVAEQHKVTVDFAAEGVPREVPQDVSLCVFRILQESLNNAIKHSGAQHFEVRLRAVSDDIQLIVRDYGAGFDAQAALSGQGLGLISMRERASLIKGTISIASKPMAGTEITLRVPIAVNRETQAISGAA
jgi:PAS domain S-box-containing protein